MPTQHPTREQKRRWRKTQLVRARWYRRMLIETLGGKCAECGEVEPTLLSVDHVDGITWNRWRLRADARVNRYIEEFCAGVRLRVLCLACNGRFGRMAQLEREPGDDVDDTERIDEKLRSYGQELPDAPF